MQPPLVVLTGPPGAGKTTVGRLVANSFSPMACVIESDWFWTTLAQGHIEPWLPEADAQNRTLLRSFITAAAVMVEGGYPTVLEGIVGPWQLDVLYAATASISQSVHYVVLRPSLEVTLQRGMGRKGEAPRVPGHAALTDEEPIRDLWRQFYDLGRLEPHAIDTSEMTEQEAAAAVVNAVESSQFRLGKA